MYFPIHDVPETFDKLIGNYIYNHYITDGTNNYIPEFLYIHLFRIVENRPIVSGVGGHLPRPVDVVG